MQRRTLLNALATLPLAASTGALWALPSDKPRLLLVFLRGAYDAANLLVPVTSELYYETRPNIAVARSGLKTALTLNADWGLHPALVDSIYPMFKNGQAAFVPFAGTQDASRSHFETQDSIELGQALGSKSGSTPDNKLDNKRNYRSGFLNRLAGVLGKNSAKTSMAFTQQLPLIMQGELQIPNSALRNLGKPGIDDRQSRIIAAMYQGTRLERQVQEGFVIRDEVLKEVAREMEAADRNAVTAKGFEQEARRIARLMKDKYRLAFVDVGGWDTHVNEGGATGYLAQRFEELGRGLAGFAQEMGNAWQDTVVVVMSEFGRTLRENGNRGTDHGHGSVYWVLGGGIQGGQILGEQVAVEADTLFQNRDLPVLNEYRALLGGLFMRMYGLDAKQLEQVFAGAKAQDWGLV
jgi:uncharacterized protein (DUF1501 family)